MSKIKYLLNPAFHHQKNEILDCLERFDSLENVIYNGKRNTLKKVHFQDSYLAIKKFHAPFLLKRFIYSSIRDSKAKRSFENANYLINKGISTPQPIGFLENYHSRVLGDSYYISSFLDYDFDFHEVLRNEQMPNRNRIISGLAKFTYQLHEANILFKDHSPGNTLIKKTEQGLSYHLIDLNRMAFKSLTFEERIKNFSRITPHKWMVEIMAQEYARLIQEDEQLVFQLMWKSVDQFQKRYYGKKKWKKRLGL